MQSYTTIPTIYHFTHGTPNKIFVFGSNSSGFHGAGAAGFAMLGVQGNKWRTVTVPGTDKILSQVPNGTPGYIAVKGTSHGFQTGRIGSSYAICTVVKPGAKKSIGIVEIARQIGLLYEFARKNSSSEFIIAQGNKPSLNGHSVNDMASAWFHVEPPDNVVFYKPFLDFCNRNKFAVKRDEEDQMDLF